MIPLDCLAVKDENLDTADRVDRTDCFAVGAAFLVVLGKLGGFCVGILIMLEEEKQRCSSSIPSLRAAISLSLIGNQDMIKAWGTTLPRPESL